MESSMYPFLADVVYSSDPDSQFIKEFEEDLIVIKKFFFNHLSNIEDDENVSKFFYSLMHYACRYKHWGFKEENEVRVVALPYPLHHEEFDKDMKAEGITVSEISRKHFSRAGALVPYIDIFNGITSRADKKTLPIKRIIVGPTQNTQEKNRRINAVKLLINQHGIKADEQLRKSLLWVSSTVGCADNRRCINYQELQYPHQAACNKNSTLIAS